MAAEMPEVKAVDEPQEFWFYRPGNNGEIDRETPIQEIVPVKRAIALQAKGWELVAVGPMDGGASEGAPSGDAAEAQSEFDAVSEEE